MCNQEQSTKHSGEQVPELCASAVEDTFVIVYVSVTTDDYLPSRERERLQRVSAIDTRPGARGGGEAHERDHGKC